MRTSGTRRLLAAVTIMLAAMAQPALAATGADQPQPCAVTYTATPHGAGNPITTTFAVSCTADPTWEITSIEQQTTLRDTTPTGAQVGCHQQVPGTTATQTCSMSGARLHTYAVTYRLLAWGNYPVCADDGTCDPLTPVEDPACAWMVAAQTPARTDLVLDCTYRQLVTVGPT